MHLSSPFGRQPRTPYAFARSPLYIGLVLLLLFFADASRIPTVASAIVDSEPSSPTRSLIDGDHFALEDAVFDAKRLLVSLGVPESNLCRIEAPSNYEDILEEYNPRWALPLCDDYTHSFDESINGDSEYRRKEAARDSRRLEEEETIGGEDPLFYVVMASCALLCVMTAALAAGLTMGMLSLDPLMLLVKIRASRSPEEKKQAEALLPIVKQHHMLLVTLLLLNSMSNEALPLFLDRLVSPFVAVLLSVTFVLIFGEILPSAIFTGPKKLELASKMVPMVKAVMILVWPIAFPIARLLDKFLHSDEGEDDAFNRGEISALVRIQYEERMANKRQRKLERMRMGTLGASSSSLIEPPARPSDVESMRMSLRNMIQFGSSTRSMTDAVCADEVTMVEGALKMKTKTAVEVFQPLHRMFAIPEDLILNEYSIVDIYSSGYSRIPVYEKNSRKPKSRAGIKGILNTKNLMVVNMNETRPLSTMPLQVPPCVSPKMNMVDLLNLFQRGREGHIALVCARPQLGTDALKEGNSIPDAAGFMGIITLEDVLEELLQEEIFDEKDQMMKDMERIAFWVGRKWKNLKRKRIMRAEGKLASIGDAVDQLTDKTTNESTHLLARDESEKKVQMQNSGLLDSVLQGLGMN